ncbi:MAG: amidohydrolase family protein [Candidatus Solibacter usitatus]|nr:amidohydrolase family protein [Candidatus Solibacter usitatus]
MLVIDTHAHIYSPDEKRYPVIEKPLRPPAGSGSLEQLREVTKANAVQGACLIQVSTFYRFDNRYICDSAIAAKQWTAGVCTLDPEDTHSPGMLKHFAEKYSLRGMRSIPARGGKLDHPGVRALWKSALESGIVINALINLEQAPQLETLLQAFPKLPVVLDHCLSLKAGPQFEKTLDAVLRLARFRNLHAKLTFLPTGSTTGYPCTDMHAPCLKIIDAFGGDRCVWGSDFPCDLWTPRVTYAEHLRIFQRDLPLKDPLRAQILGETAKKLWFPAAMPQ